MTYLHAMCQNLRRVTTIALAAAVLHTTPLAATENVAVGARALADDKTLALVCLERLDAEEAPTDWSQCLNLIFEPCAAETVGSEPHLNCLTEQRLEWRLVIEDLQAQVMDVVTLDGATTLNELLGQWTGYVVQKCNAVAAEKAGISAEAAQLGCEITEMVGLSGEYAACLEGRSAAPYCAYPE